MAGARLCGKHILGAIGAFDLAKQSECSEPERTNGFAHLAVAQNEQAPLEIDLRPLQASYLVSAASSQSPKTRDRSCFAVGALSHQFVEGASKANDLLQR